MSRQSSHISVLQGGRSQSSKSLSNKQNLQIAGGVGQRSALIQKLRAKIDKIEQRPVSLTPGSMGAAQPACPLVPRPLRRSCSPSISPLSPSPSGREGLFSGTQNWTFDLREIDDALPYGGLKRSGVHEIKPAAYADRPAALAFMLALIARNIDAENHAPILWCFTDREAQEFGLPYGPGLLRFGLDPGALIFVQISKARDVLWAMEEGLKANAVAAVIGEIDEVSVTPARRLTLAAGNREGPATPCFILSGHSTPGTGPALTRWRIGGHVSSPHMLDPRAPGFSCWHVELERTRHGPVNLSWNLERRDDTHRFRLAAPLADRTAEADSRQAIANS